MRILTFLSLFATAAVAGCTTVEEVKGPDGRAAYVLKCGDEANCFSKAGEICPKGYSLVSSQVSSTVVPMATGGPNGAPVSSLFVQCSDQSAAKQ